MGELIRMFRIWKRSRQAKKFIKAQIYVSAHSPMYDPPKIENVFAFLAGYGISKSDLDCASLRSEPKQKPVNNIIKD